MPRVVREFDLGGGRTVQLVDHTTPEQRVQREIDAAHAVTAMLGSTPRVLALRDKRLQEIHDFLTAEET